MEPLFEWLQSLADPEGPAWLLLFGAFAWGLASLLLSPCHLASIPLLVGYLEDDGDLTPRRATTLSAAFATGIVGSIAVVGAITAAAGRLIGDAGPWTTTLTALVLVVVGLHFLGWLPLSWESRFRETGRGRGLPGAALLGFLFGVALGPCTFAFLAPVLGVVFSCASSQPAKAGALLAAFAVGHGLVIVLAGASLQRTQTLLNWNTGSKVAKGIKSACGLLVLVAGAAMLWREWAP